MSKNVDEAPEDKYEAPEMVNKDSYERKREEDREKPKLNVREKDIKNPPKLKNELEEKEEGPKVVPS